MSGPTPARCLVVAKAPVAGRVKTRLGATVGMAAAAELAAAALLDTLHAARTAYGAERCVCALDGRPDEGVRGPEVAAALAGWTVLGQRGGSLGDRLAHAYADLADRLGPGPVVQIGMDTPQVTPDDLGRLEGLLAAADAALGPALDGGWWGLALRDPRHAEALRAVPMSTPGTASATRVALRGRGLRVARGPLLRDVDLAEDAPAVAAASPEGRFALSWRSLGVVAS